MAENKLLSNLGVAVGDVLSAAMELQTRSGTAVALRVQVAFMDGSDTLVSGGLFDGENIDDVYGDYAASPNTDGPWYRSRLFNMVVPSGAVKVNVGFAFDSSTIGTIVSSRKPILNKGFKPAPYSQTADNLASLSVFSLAATDWLAFDKQGIARKALVSGINLTLFNNNLPRTEITSGPSSSSNVLDLDLSVSNVFVVTLNENITTTTISNVISGTNVQVILLKLTQDGTGGFTFSFPSGTIWAGGSAPTITVAANAIDIYKLTTYDNGTSYFGEVLGQNFS